MKRERGGFRRIRVWKADMGKGGVCALYEKIHL
jgi:hypothetical protein